MPSEKPMRLAVVGLGRVGLACADLIARSHDLTVTALVRRPSSGLNGIPERHRHIPVATYAGQARESEGALICVPTTVAGDLASQMLRLGVPIVDCATLHGDAFERHKAALHALARRHKTVAIVGAGWDPGLLSILRSWLALLTPGGATDTIHHAGVNLRHTVIAKGVAGVKDALCAEVRAADGRLQRYVYVELEPGASADRVTGAVRADPLFLGEDTQVFVVESVAALEREERGIVLDRRGPAGQSGHHPHLVVEARCDETDMTAQAMVAAARALRELEAGAYSFVDVPLRLLWGGRANTAERDWL